ncbi:MAG: carboxypeptidase-like regulatory domain-containing protein, partial [Bacteroidota bacterium]
MDLNFPKQLFLLLLFCLPLNLAAQKYTISGYIEDAESGEKLIAANVYDLKTGAGAVTNTYGFFSLTLPSDSVHLSFSYIGYVATERRFFLNKNETLNIKLGSSVELETVEVVGQRYERIEEETQMSRVDIPGSNCSVFSTSTSPSRAGTFL